MGCALLIIGVWLIVATPFNCVGIILIFLALMSEN